ncbi:PAS domain S-box protein [Microvirga sp. VF16]|uniref:PAS domain S-box protein n=1 Tax=Microvirga sp. VF16 TaxID=2807101 RepID=UPI00193D71F9|nr:PAS domain S-box protein [Microvirga sp. VF16]QRM34323.1 PAS domain S-box protein [Microvirga sp. VF16]
MPEVNACIYGVSWTMKRLFRSSIRQHLLAFNIALILPVLVFAAVLVWWFTEAESRCYERDARDAAQRIIIAVDRELTEVLATAQALAAAASFDSEYEAFHRRTHTILRSMLPEESAIYALVVRDTTGQQVVNTRLPWDTSLPKDVNLRIDQEVINTKSPFIQDLFVSQISGDFVVDVRVPVLKDGQVTHVLSVVLEPKRFTKLLQTQSIPADCMVALVDRADRIIAHSWQYDDFVGRLATEDLHNNAIADEGAWEGEIQEGSTVLAAYTRSRLSGWRAVVGVRSEVTEQPLKRSLWAAATLGLALTGLSCLFALGFGQRITAPIQALADQARMLGVGAPVVPLDTGLYEVDNVSRALSAASSKLRQREASLRQSEGRLWATQENAAVGIAEVDREGRFVYVNEARCKLTGHTREELLGLHFTHANIGAELEADRDLFFRHIAGKLDVYTIEKRHVRKDGAKGWTRVSSSAVRDDSGHFLYAVRIVEDITERKRAEERQKFLVDELNHRVKNTLATVQSLAWQSLRQGLPPEIARDRFEARLLALSRAHNLLNETGWEAASLCKILNAELGAFGIQQQYTLTGSDVDLPPRAAVALAMAFHELATNALKHGALSVPTGRILVEWRSEIDDGGTILDITWLEVSGPRVGEPTVAGFGTRLLKRTVQRELAGSLDMQYRPEGLACQMRLLLGGLTNAAAEATGHSQPNPGATEHSHS